MGNEKTLEKRDKISKGMKKFYADKGLIRKDKVIRARVTPEQFEAINEMARKGNLTVTDLIIKALGFENKP